MKDIEKQIADPWYSLRAYTPARIAIGRTGCSIPVEESLQFKLAHANARDAVYSVMDIPSLINQLENLKIPALTLHSKAGTRQQYLQRPDLGRELSRESAQHVNEISGTYDLSIIIADGLSAQAVNVNAVPLLQRLVKLFLEANRTLAPVCLVQQGRVAISDEIGETIGAKLSIVLIGERPGLSSPESLGVYLTWKPIRGLTDDSRNCISNIHRQGLSYDAAAKKIFYLVHQSFQRKISGIHLKDESGSLTQE